MISEGTDVPITLSTHEPSGMLKSGETQLTWLPYDLHHAVYICENKGTDQLHSNPKGNDAHLKAIINLYGLLRCSRAAN